MHPRPALLSTTPARVPAQPPEPRPVHRACRGGSTPARATPRHPASGHSSPPCPFPAGSPHSAGLSHLPTSIHTLPSRAHLACPAAWAAQPGQLTSPRPPDYSECPQHGQTGGPATFRELLFVYRLPQSKPREATEDFISRTGRHHWSVSPGLQHTAQCKNAVRIYTFKKNLPLLGSL